MSDRGDEGNGDLFGPDRSDRDELWGPPRQSEDPGTGERPSSGVGDEPTRMMPGGPGGPGGAGGSEPTSVMPPVGGGPFGPGYPPDDPRHPGAPGGPAGPGGPGGPVGPDDPEFDEFGEEDVPWYRQPGPLAAAIAGAIALILGIIALAVLAGDDDGDEITDASTTSTSSSTTVAPTVSAVAPTTVPPTQPPTTPPPTEPPTTLPATTTTSSTTTTSTTTTTTTTTTTPPTTSPPTTEEPERPTTTSPREPTTTVAIPDQPTAWDYIIRAPELGQLEGYVRQAGMIDIFERPGITVLAPIDQAFTDMASYEDGAALLGDDARLAELLQRHVLVEALTAEDILDRDSLATVGGDSLAVDGGTIEGASIVSPDHESGDGSLVQMVDPVLVGDLLGG